MNRRELIKIGVGTLAAPASVNLALAGVDNIHAADVFVVDDPRYAASRRFAHELQSKGADILTLKGDLGRQWFGSLRSTLANSDRPLAGITDELTLFCFEQLARDVGMKVVVRDDLQHLSGTSTSPRMISWLMA